MFVEVRLKLKGTWVLPPWSSSCCSKGTRPYYHNTPEAHTGTSCNTSDRKTCRACGIGSCYISSSTVMGILVISHPQKRHIVSIGKKQNRASVMVNPIINTTLTPLFSHTSQNTKQKQLLWEKIDHGQTKIDSEERCNQL